MAASLQGTDAIVARSEREISVSMHARPSECPSQAERRRHGRHRPSCFCWIEAQDLTLFAPVQDIGPGGLFVRTAARLPPGTTVEVSVKLAGEPDSQRIRATVARTSQCGPRGLGIRFQTTIPELD